MPHQPPYDRELEAALAVFASSGLPGAITADTIGELRDFGNQFVMDDAVHEGVLITDHVVTADGAGQSDVPVVVIRPRGYEDLGPLPGMLYVHGGGMISGQARVGIDMPIEWMRHVPMVVVSVDYRLAPEHPYPAPLEDCHVALRWMAAQADQLNVDLTRLVVAGGSAGGGLAAGVALMARDRGGPDLAGQMLMCPMLDDRTSATPVDDIYADGTWNHTANATGWTAFLGERFAGTDVSPYAAPARATDLSRLPPAFIDVGSAEIFRDEDVAYATGIWQAGGSAELHVWPGGFHGFDVAAPHAALSVDARRARIEWLRRVLG